MLGIFESPFKLDVSNKVEKREVHNNTTNETKNETIKVDVKNIHSPNCTVNINFGFKK